MKKKNITITIILIIVILSIVLFVRSPDEPGEYDAFATCLTESGAKLYGAYWCPHCNEQKEMFGKSVKKINYIECSLPNRGGQNQFCSQAGIRAYPTWEFADGIKVEGKFSFEQLSEKTGCAL